MDEMNDTNEEAPPIAWDIRREGRAWTAEEFPARADRLLGVDIEISEGKLFGSEKTMLLILGMLLENLGIDAAVRLGDLSRWKEAIATAEQQLGEGRQKSARRRNERGPKGR
jgi:hypothetical protein